ATPELQLVVRPNANQIQYLKVNRRLAIIALGLTLLPGFTSGQAIGEFVIPGIRANDGTEFSYWDQFIGDGNFVFGFPRNFDFPNEPAIAGGDDFDGNFTNNFAPTITQTATNTAIVTSSNSVYSFAAQTAFEADYDSTVAVTADINNVIFQTRSLGSRLDINDFSLEYVDTQNQVLSVTPVFKALDDPQTGDIFEILVSAVQWDLTGMGVRDFTIKFAASSTSLSLNQAQMDVTSGVPFAQELGYIFVGRLSPRLRDDIPGNIDKGLAPGVEDRFFFQGQTLELEGFGTQGFEHVGWEKDGVITDTAFLDPADSTFEVTFGDSDLTTTAIFAPTSYFTWREHFFFHENVFGGGSDDFEDDAISGPLADPDGDGDNNFCEYCFAGDPYTQDKERKTPTIEVVEIEGVQYPAITYRKWGVEEFLTDLEYFVEVSADGKIWNRNGDIGGPFTAVVGSELQRDGSRLVTVRATAPLSTSNRLLMRVWAQEFQIPQ
ncbi:MAG: hypothetical protein AAGA58_20045, partial [Verrucomicrobiota bacterium]